MGQNGADTRLPPDRPFDMRFPKKFALVCAGAIGALVLVLATVPLLFRGRLEALARAQVSEAVNARVAWGGVGLSVLRDFPNVTLSLHDLSVVGAKPFAGDTLLAMPNARFVLDLASVMRHVKGGDRIVVREIALDRPAVNLRVLADGTANWNIARQAKSTRADTTSGIGITLRSLRITDASVRMDDQQSRLVASVHGLDESLSGDFAQKTFVLSTRTHADAVSAQFGGIPYLTRVALGVNADIDADMAAHRFTFRNDSVRLNDLVLAFGGSVVAGSPNTALDLTFSTPSTAFRDILSLLPAIYARDFARLQTAGTMAVSGRVRGQYGPKAFPALAVRARVADGGFKYPSLPVAARGIALDLAIDNPGGDVDNTVVDLKRLHAVIGRRPIDARFVIRTPVSDPDVDARVVGSLDLADIGRTVKLQSVRQLSGIVAANVAMRARVSDVDAQRFDRVSAAGTVLASHIGLRSDAIPYPMAVDTAALRFTPRTAQLTAFAGRIGSSDVRATGALDNVIGFLLHDEDLRGRARVASNRFVLDEWKSKDETTEVIPVPPHVDFALVASARRVTYGPLTLADVTGDLKVKEQRVTIDNLRMQTLGGTVTASGYYETTTPARPTFDMTMQLAKVSIPAAFTSLATVQKIAPIAKWAQGNVSGAIAMKGPIGQDMTPVFNALSGKGTVETEQLALSGAPVLEKLGSVLSLDQVKKPALGAIKASFDVADGRVHVQPFAVKMNGIDMTVSGSNGFDQSIRYDLAMAVPHSMLGSAATSTVSRLASQAGKAGIRLAANDVVQLGAQITGTVSDPVVKPSFAGVAGSAADAARYVVRQAAESATKAAKQKADSVAGEAARRAREQADRILAEADSQATRIRAEGRSLADKTKQVANARADSLVARAQNPVAKLAAQAAADRLRKEASSQADRIVNDADAKADAVMAAARQQADALTARQP